MIGGWGLGCILHSVGVEWGGNGTILSHISWHFPERSLTVMPQTLGTWHHCCCCLRIAFRGWIVVHLTVLLRLSQPGAARESCPSKEAKSTNCFSYMQLVADLADHNSSGVHCWWSIKHSIGVRVRLLRVAFGLLAMGGGLG